MKIDLIFLIILCVVIAYVFILYKVEQMADTTNTTNIDQIKEAIKQVYLTDVDAIRNLSAVATKLQSEGLTIPGNLTTNIINATDNINVSNKTNEGGRIRILNELKNGKADQTNDWSIFNMTGQYGNKLAFWRYNGDGKNAGSALDLYDNGNVGVQGNLTTQGNIDIKGSSLTTPPNHVIRCAGRQHIGGEELLYVLSKNGVMIGKEWGGTGDLQVQGNLIVQGRNILAELDAAIKYGANISIQNVASEKNMQASANDNVVRCVPAAIGAWERFTIKKAPL